VWRAGKKLLLTCERNQQINSQPSMPGQACRGPAEKSPRSAEAAGYPEKGFDRDSRKDARKMHIP